MGSKQLFLWEIRSNCVSYWSLHFQCRIQTSFENYGADGCRNTKESRTCRHAKLEVNFSNMQKGILYGACIDD